MLLLNIPLGFQGGSLLHDYQSKPLRKKPYHPQSFGLTEMGRDLLAEDYMLKQITASLIYPEGATGKKFWKRIYQQAAQKFRTTDIPVNTFNKVWIIPAKAVVYENAKAGTAYIVESKLKVMLEQDYLALEKNNVVVGSNPTQERAGYEPAPTDVNQLGSQIVREIVIPELTKEVNEGQNFSQLRQVYNSLILATWYKKKIKDSILSQVYADKNKVYGVEYKTSVIADTLSLPGRSPKQSLNTDITLIYQRYLQAFKRGVYNYIKEEQDPLTQEVIPRKYFSGGFDAALIAPMINYTREIHLTKRADNARIVTVDCAMTNKWGKILKGAWSEYYLRDHKNAVHKWIEREFFNRLLKAAQLGNTSIDIKRYWGMTSIAGVMAEPSAVALLSWFEDAYVSQRPTDIGIITDIQIAYSIAHEIAHISFNHISESRANEVEATLEGVDILLRAGYSPEGIRQQVVPFIRGIQILKDQAKREGALIISKRQDKLSRSIHLYDELANAVEKHLDAAMKSQKPEKTNIPRRSFLLRMALGAAGAFVSKALSGQSAELLHGWNPYPYHQALAKANNFLQSMVRPFNQSAQENPSAKMILSYAGLTNINDPSYNTMWVYNGAQAIEGLISSNKLVRRLQGLSPAIDPRSIAQARDIADGLLILRQREQLPDGQWVSWWYNGYDISSGKPLNSQQLTRDVGATSTVIRVLADLYSYTKESKYLEAAQEAMDYIILNDKATDGVYEFFMGGQSYQNGAWVNDTYASTENNCRMIMALYALWKNLPDGQREQYQEHAQRIAQWLVQKMWNGSTFSPGYDQDLNDPNRFSVDQTSNQRTDVQFLPIIALQTAQEILFNQNHDPLLNPQNYTAAIQSLGAEHSIVYKGKIVTGWAKVSNNISPTGSSPIWVNDPDSVWLEGTLEGVCALYILGEKTRADNILDSILAIQDQTTGGLSSIVDDLNRAWPYNFAYLGLDATSALISALQYRVNAQGNYLVKAKYKLSSSVDSAQLIFTVRNIHIEDNKPLKIEGHLQHVNPEDGLVAVSPQKEYLASVASCVAILVYDQQGRAVGFRHYSSFGFNPGIFQKEFKDFLNNEYHFVIIRGSRDIMERQAAYTRQLSDYLINTSKLSKANIFFYDSDKYNNLPNAFGVLVVLRKTGNVTVTFTDISTRYRYGQEEIVPVAPSGRRDEAMIVLEKVIAGLIGQLNPKNRALFESKYRVEDLLKWFGLYANAFLSERALIDFLKRSFWELNVPEPATPFALWDEERASIEKGFDSIVAELNETQEKIPITIATFGIGKQKKDLIETARIALERLSAYKDRVEIQLVGIDKQGEILAEPMDFNSITEDHGWQNRIHYHAFFGDIRNKALWEHLAQKIKPNIILFRYNWTAKSVEQGEFIEAMTRHSSFGFVVARQNGSPWAETKVFNNKKSMAAAQGKSAAMTAEGGIDFKPDKVGPAFFIQNNGEESIRFHMDPAMLAKLQNASGFVPVIITIRPMEDIQSFLGLNGQK